jgi:excisionase family DNA binding protein
MSRQRTSPPGEGLGGGNHMKLAYSRKQTCETLSIGTTKLHDLINAGTLETFKIGRKTLIKAESLHRLVAGEA